MAITDNALDSLVFLLADEGDSRFAVVLLGNTVDEVYLVIGLCSFQRRFLLDLHFTVSATLYGIFGEFGDVFNGHGFFVLSIGSFVDIDDFVDAYIAQIFNFYGLLAHFLAAERSGNFLAGGVNHFGEVSIE
jgi:hypothetical protein